MKQSLENAFVPNMKQTQKWAVLSPLFYLFSKAGRQKPPEQKRAGASSGDQEFRDDVHKFQGRLQGRIAAIEEAQSVRREIRSLILDPHEGDRLKKDYRELVESLVGLCSCNVEADGFLDFLANASVSNKFPDYFLDAVIEVQDTLRQAHPSINDIRADGWSKIYHLESNL